MMNNTNNIKSFTLDGTTVNFDERVKEHNVLEYVKKLLQKYGLPRDK